MLPALFSRRLVVTAGWLSIALVVSSIAHAAPYIELGPSDGVALDQPRVAVAVVDPATDTVLGPEFSNTFLLDTGANNILIAANAYSELSDQGYQTVAQYDDIGIGGTTTFDVSKAYEFDFAGDDGLPIALPNTRMMSSDSADVGFDGIVGTPALMGRTTNLDFTVWSGGNLDQLRTNFSNAAPPVVPGQYHVPLTLQNFPPSGQHNPNDPLPTFAPLITAPVEVHNATRTFTGDFIVDTGAQISIISTATALALGIDPEIDAVDALDLSGIAGTVTVPVVNVDSLAVKTTEHVNLQWTGLQFGIYDIDPSIAGIFGMDFLTSGWLEALFGGPDGYLTGVHFDFRNWMNQVATMTLDVNPLLNHVIMVGDANHDGVVNGLDISAVASHWLTSGSGIEGDVNGDGVVNGLDVSLVATNWLTAAPGASGAAAVPEPGTGALLAAATVTIGTLRFMRGRGVRRLQQVCRLRTTPPDSQGLDSPGCCSRENRHGAENRKQAEQSDTGKLAFQQWLKSPRVPRYEAPPLTAPARFVRTARSGRGWMGCGDNAPSGAHRRRCAGHAAVGHCLRADLSGAGRDRM